MGEQDLAALAPAWRALLTHSDANTPFLSPDWLLTWWGLYGPHAGRSLRVLRFDDPQTGQLIGLAPLLTRRHWHFRCLPFRRLEPLASGEPDADAIGTDYLGVIAHRDHAAAVARAFAHALTRGPLRHSWHELILPHMDGTTAMPQLLADALRGAGLRVDLETTTHAPILPLPATWEAFLAGLDRKERYLVNRTLRDLESWSGGGWKVMRASDEATRQEGLRILRALHEARWEGTAGGTFRSPLFLSFHDQLTRKLLPAGAVDLSWLLVRGEPVASMYSFTWAGTTYFYQCGRKRDVPTQVRPGGMMLYLSIRHAIESGQRAFDFLGGEATYKRQLTRQVKPLVRLRAARPTAREAARRLGERAKDGLRPAWRGLKRTLLRRESAPPPAEKSEKSA